jgi:hypothetical protein
MLPLKSNFIGDNPSGFEPERLAPTIQFYNVKLNLKNTL